MKYFPWIIFGCCLALAGCKTSGGTAHTETITSAPSDDFRFEVLTGERPINKNPGAWVLIESLSDQFGEGEIDARKWNDNPDDWGPWSWEPDNVFQEDNVLNIRIRYEEHQRNGTDMFYKSGIIRSLDTITYGYVEARIKGLKTFPGASPAFWTYSLGQELDGWGMRGKEEGDIRYSEVDVVEMQQAEWSRERGRHGPEVIDCNLHTVVVENGKDKWKRPTGYPELTKNEFIAPWDPGNDYHTYGAEIAPDKVTWYIDDVKVAEKGNLYWHLPMHVTLSLGLRYPHVTYKDCPGGAARCPVPEAATREGFPATMKVDWVRAYRKKT
ncbi:kappa-carrageenase [Neolewinella persica]|uniref:kappa-carrageenase n=1 Tax=Neolewinella persica TaxID=70998 RepID=UPI00037EBBFA|nr:kappa-carrageenase [Neolewinella persica]